MPFLPQLAVVFLGIIGGDRNVDRQVKSLVHELDGVKTASVPAETLRTLTHHGERTKDIIKKLHADGVIGFEVVTGHGTPTLRLVIYDGEGGLKTYVETPLGRGGLGADDLDVLRSNMQDDLASLGVKVAAPPPPPAPKAAPLPKAAPAEQTFDDDEDPLAGKKAVKSAKAAPAPAPAKITPATPPAEAFASSAPASDETADAPGEGHSAKPVQTADAVDVSEIEALTSGGSVDAAAPAPQASTLHLGFSLGLAAAGRNFAPTVTTVTGYSSSPVGALTGEAHVSPTKHMTLAVFGERTLAMTTPLHDEQAPTSMSRWEAVARYAVVDGAFQLAPEVGAGRRSFAIASSDPSRSPDGDYNYLIAGVTARYTFGSRVTIKADAAFQPVVSGVEPTEMAFGEATRWATDVGAAVELRLPAHLFARAAANYQRFTWSWDMAGARGAGGAVDEYASGSLSLGADY